MRFLNVKTNALRRLPDDSYTLNSKHNKNALCDACALYDTCQSSSSDTQVLSCSYFKPVLVFRDGTNLDKESYNTIRTGMAWHKRLRVSQVVSVYDKESGQLSDVKVTALYWSEDKAILLDSHAKNNHIGMELNSPADELGIILKKSYGSGFYAKSKGLTAIYLSNIL